jgi:hypothetical protein
VEEPPVGGHLLIRPAAVRVDPVDHLLGQPPQLFGAELVGEPGQQFLPGRNLGRVEPGPVHPR